MPLSSFWSCQKSLVFLALWMNHITLCLHHHVEFSSVPVSVPSPDILFSVHAFKLPSSCKDASHWIRAHPSPVWPYFNLLPSSKDQLPNKVTITGTRQRSELEHVFLNHSTHNTVICTLLPRDFHVGGVNHSSINNATGS